MLNIRFKDNKLNIIVDAYKEQYKRGDIDASRCLEVFQPMLEKIGILAEGFDKNIVALKK